MKLLNTLQRYVLSELSAAIKQKMVDKFQMDTDDNIEIITDLVNKFENIQNKLSADKRDINKYSYDELKQIVNSELENKGEYTIRSIFSFLKKLNKQIPDEQAKLYIKKYLEIRSELPKDKNDVYKYNNYEELVKIVDDNYAALLAPKMLKKYLAQAPDTNKDTLVNYINRYINNFNRIPVSEKSIIKLSFIELEHLLDGMVNDENQSEITSTINSVPVIYDENNLIIWAPQNKEQCISLAQGRGWCTSQPGSGNLYYNYRYGSKNLTLYYVTDKDLPINDVDYASVILVDRNGDMRLADKTNRIPFHGSTIHPWSTIVSKIPKLEGLKDLLKWRPLSDKEVEVFSRFNKLSTDRVGDNPLKYFKGDNETLDLWMEINSPLLTDIQYKNIPIESKKKWIGLQLPLSPGKINYSEPKVLSYILSKYIDKIVKTSLYELTETEVALLLRPELVTIKNNLKEKFIQAINFNEVIKEGECELIYPNNKISIFISLYGLDELITVLPKNLEGFIFNNRSESIFS